MIAPLWADFNFRESGNLYYRVVNDNNTLNAIVDRISREAPIYTDYSPTEALIVTWFQSSVFESQSNFTVISYSVDKSWELGDNFFGKGKLHSKNHFGVTTIQLSQLYIG